MNIVRALRKAEGLGPKELAEIAGVSVATVSDWETQKKNPSGDRLRKLAEHFRVNPLVVLGVMEPPVRDEDGLTVPQTIEARILATGVDQLPKRERERALEAVRFIFENYSDLFAGKEETNEA